MARFFVWQGVVGCHLAGLHFWRGQLDMGDANVIVECLRDGKVIASYPFLCPGTADRSATPDKAALIEEAKEKLVEQGFVRPPFGYKGIEFKIRY
jgi:hypothetical protein